MDFATIISEIINREHDGLSVEDYLRESVSNFCREIARDECSYCQRGDPPSRRPHKGLYAHRLPEGKSGGMVWVPCRAAMIWKRIAEIAAKA